jgi:hypothetical protein
MHKTNLKGESACKTLTIFKEAKARARGAKTLTTWEYSPTCPKARFHFNQCGGGKTKT